MDCPQPLLIHADGTGSCSIPDCLDHDTLTEAVLRHRHVVNCHAVLGDRCAVCRRAQARGAETTSPSEAPCPGTAVVHRDGSVECSVAGCEMNPGRGAWLARHADVQSCRHRDADCPRCSQVPTLPD